MDFKGVLSDKDIPTNRAKPPRHDEKARYQGKKWLVVQKKGLVVLGGPEREQAYFVKLHAGLKSWATGQSGKCVLSHFGVTHNPSLGFDCLFSLITRDHTCHFGKSQALPPTRLSKPK